MIGVLMLATAVVRNLLRSKVSLVTVVFVELKQRGRVATSPDLPILEEVPAREVFVSLMSEMQKDDAAEISRIRRDRRDISVQIQSCQKKAINMPLTRPICRKKLKT
jgi:hypothetical protein